VVSIGMFPPIPKPVKATSASIAGYELGAAIKIPKVEHTKTVPLKAHFRPVSHLLENESLLA
jgi:hypothetical protein